MQLDMMDSETQDPNSPAGEIQSVNPWSGDHGRKPGWIHLVVFVMLVITGIVTGGFSSLTFKITENIDPSSPAYGVNYFWLGITVQQVGSIWFGAWGVMAGMIFPIVSNTVSQASLLTSLAYLPANFFQSFLPAFMFRRLKLDLELRSGKDLLYLFISMIVSNLFGALWSVFMLVVILGQLDRNQALTSFFGWFGGNLAAGIVFNFLLLKTLSKKIVRSKALVKKWWA